MREATIVVFLFLLFTTSRLLPATSARPPPPPPAGCVDELVAFSPCLSYVSAPPNNVTETAASQCCEAFSSVLDSGDGNCLCYLFRQPLIFSFPLNQTRVASLSLVCNTSRSLESICTSAPPSLPPLRNITGPDISKPDGGNTTSPEISKPSNSATGHHHHHSSARPDNVKAPSMSSPAKRARNSPPTISTPAQPARKSPPTSSFLPGNSVRSPTTPSSSAQQVRGSFPTKQIFNCSWFLPGVLIFALVFIHV